jgi:hypothetical protein
MACTYIHDRHQCPNNAVNDNLCQVHFDFREQIRKEIAMKNLTATVEGGRYFRYHFLGFPCAYIEPNGKKCIWNVYDENLICCEHHKDHEEELQQERRKQDEHKQPCKAVLKSGKVCGVSFCKRHRKEKK